jgi:hypothetical protein
MFITPLTWLICAAGRYYPRTADVFEASSRWKSAASFKRRRGAVAAKHHHDAVVERLRG